MRTLVISDLHLGNRGRRDVLRRPVAVERLLDALDGIDRLVLLGDTLEFHGRHAERALGVARPVLAAIGARMAAGEIVLVPGNHDHDLIRDWIRERGDGLGLADPVPADASPGLISVLAMLAPARVRVSYPGVWLADGVYAIHGQYADRHLAPESAVGLLRREAPRPMTPAGYERPRLRARSPGRRGLGARLARARRKLRTTILFRMMPFLVRPALAPVVAKLVDAQMRRCAVPALARMIANLGVSADWVLFGHVHRLGPTDGDDPTQWRTADRRTGLINTGSWQYERLLAGRAEPPHPYWPGGGVLLEPGHPPHTVGLLDGLRRSELAPGTESALSRRPRPTDR